MSKPVAALALITLFAAAPAFGETIDSAYTELDARKCPHHAGQDVEDYGSWSCRGYDGTSVYFAAGDQRMFISFGPRAAREPAAEQTFPAFNDAYRVNVEWRIAKLPDGRRRPFATIVRWNVRLAGDERDVSGRVLVVTRLGPGGVCHVGYVDARANPDANALARRLADETARSFRCGEDKPKVMGVVGAGLAMPGAN